jgi:hypothetical protein
VYSPHRAFGLSELFKEFLDLGIFLLSCHTVSNKRVLGDRVQNTVQYEYEYSSTVLVFLVDIKSIAVDGQWMYCTH